MNFKMDLDLEEQLAYEFALHWRDENYHPDLQGIDWRRFANILTHNRMAVLARQIFARVNPSIPPDAQRLLREQAEKYERTAVKFGEALSLYLQSAETRTIPTIVLKGLWLCEKIYHVPSMRPGGDIDILVRHHDVDACLKVLAEQGIDEFWPNLLNDEYFTRHHLHQQRSTKDLNIWFEIHWAFDHPYTLLTVNYESIFARARSAELLGAPIREMATPDLILSLAIHLVKHAVYLPSLVDREDLPRIILADGMLMYYLDITEVLKQHQRMEWDLTIQLTREWGAVDILGSVLRVCKKYFAAPVPDEVLSSLPISRLWPVTRRLMARAAEQEIATYEGREGSRFWKLALASNGAFILRPIRILETLAYFFPPADFLRRRYGKSNLLTRLRHFLIASTQTLRFGWDTLYFGMERYFRLRRLGKALPCSTNWKPIFETAEGTGANPVRVWAANWRAVSPRRAGKCHRFRVPLLDGACADPSDFAILQTLNSVALVYTTASESFSRWSAVSLLRQAAGEKPIRCLPYFKHFYTRQDGSGCFSEHSSSCFQSRSRRCSTCPSGRSESVPR